MEEKEKGIVEINLEEEMRTSYLDYAMSVIVGRALPDVRDGLKPVHRRVLYTMHEMSNSWNRAYKKSARVVGEVMGKYHPHGDTAIYDTVVRLAQDFSMLHPLIDGQGNFGSIDGDSAAAMRYTEVRMAKVSTEILADIERNTVDYTPNYDGSLQEPTVLPSKIPNLLVNGSSGIAVGMSTNIPPHNLSEVMDAIVALIKNPEMTINDIMQIIKGPDFPTAGFITGTEGIKSAYKSGRGIIKTRAKVDIEEGKKDKQKIIITELPYQVNKARLIEKIASLHKNKKLEGLSTIRDESDRTGMRIVLELKKGEIADIVVNRLYKLTQLSDSFGIITLAIHNGQPKLFNLKQYLEAFINHRKNIVTRRAIFDLKKAEARAHILEGLVKAISNIDPIVSLIKQSGSPDEARAGLQNKFSFSELQAQAILDMRLQRLTGLEKTKLEKELEELKKFIEEVTQLLADDTLIYEVIVKESEEIKAKYGKPRLTKIVASADNIDEEDLIQDEDMMVTITSQGYIKRNSPDLYKAQHRGGTGIKGMTTNEEDFVTSLFSANTKSYLLFFTNLGKVYWLKVHKIPEATRTSRGKAIVNLLSLSKVEKICSVMSVDNFDAEGSIILATKKGTIKRTELKAFSNPRTGGIIALKINSGDTLVNAVYSKGDSDILLCSKEGKSIRFNEKAVRLMGRGAAGVRGMDLSLKDELVGLAILGADEEISLLSVTTNGYGKRTKKAEYRTQSRGGKGIITMKVSEKNGDVVAVYPVSDKDDLMVISSKGQIVRIKVSSISLMGRNTQGVRLVKLKQGERVVAVEALAEK